MDLKQNNGVSVVCTIMMSVLSHFDVHGIKPVYEG